MVVLFFMKQQSTPTALYLNKLIFHSPEMSVVGQAVLSAFLQVLFDRLASPEVLKLAKRGHLFSELKKWEKLLVKMHAVLDDAEEKQLTNQSVKIWLAEVRDLAYDVEDILDEFSTKSLQTQQLLLIKPSLGLTSSSNKVKKLAHACTGFLIPSNYMFNYRIGSKVKGVSARLQEISSQRSDLDLRECVGGRGIRSKKKGERLPTTCFVNEARVFGREKDRDVVVDLLLRDSDCEGKVCVIALIGMGGIGKTTLAQVIYNDYKINDCFDVKMWVSVSDDFDVLKVTRTILESISHESVGSDLNLLQAKVKILLLEKKFLLVLDDVWNENYQNWETLYSPLRFGALGSKIVVTTRNEGVASIMGSFASYHLKELSYESCLPLFSQYSLGANNFDSHEKLRAIGEGIVEKCKGLPLAAKTLGSLLHTKHRQDEWEEILYSKIWDLPEEKSDIIPALRLSYHYLPSHLKQCFAYCSIFPKDYAFDKDELILLWMAEGFLQSRIGTKRMEKLGEKYFDDLLSRSLFQQSSSNGSLYVMHDLINDLAQYVAGEVCFRLEDRLERIHHRVLSKARHVSYIRHRYEGFKKFEVLKSAQSLRTLLPFPVKGEISWRNFYMTSKVLYDLLPKIKCLRVLSFSGYCISDLPDTIGKLKHLRYLNVSHTSIRTLPESVSALCNLQTLLLHSCNAFSKLPAGIVNLINLRHLDLMNTRKLKEMPLHMGKLTNLRTLSKFTVKDCSGLRITELRDMSRLRGTLVITGLHSVANISDAAEANLRYKKDLRELVLDWSDSVEPRSGRDDGLEMDILEMLEPHKNLEILKIESYLGTAFPSWVGDPSFTQLVSLTVKSCTKCTTLPSLGKLPLLEDLCITGLQGVKSVGLEFYGDVSSSLRHFPSMKKLTFSDMAEWDDWSSISMDEAFNSGFPCLQELTISNCPKLIRRLPKHLPSLSKLSIRKCPLLEVQLSSLPSLSELNLEDGNEVVLRSIVHLTLLGNLRICSFSNVTQMPEKLMQCALSLHVTNCSELTTLKLTGGQMFSCRLEYLELYNCNSLRELPDGLFSFKFLTSLKIKRCPKLTCFPEQEFLSTLRYLTIDECEALECLPAGVMNNTDESSSSSIIIKVSHLENLEIFKCPSLTSFPGGKFPTSLKMLKIWDCAQLEPLPEMILQNTLSLECLSFRKYINLKALPETLDHLTHLTELHISYCADLESFPVRGLPTPSLRRLYIFNCTNLQSLPSNMKSLTSLEHLGLSNCPGLVSFPEGGLPSNLASLRVSNCENLPWLSEWGMRRLVSLKDFSISGGCQKMVTFAHDFRLPATLTCLRIGKLLDLESFSMVLQNLTALEVMEIADCPKLRSLPMEQLPSSLLVLEISDCPTLKKWCLKERGKHQSMIAHLPRVEID